MPKTIRGRLFAAVVLLVVLLQLTSAFVSFVQVRTALFGRIQTEAQNLTAPLYASLRANLESILDANDRPRILAIFREIFDVVLLHLIKYLFMRQDQFFDQRQ